MPITAATVMTRLIPAIDRLAVAFRDFAVVAQRSSDSLNEVTAQLEQWEREWIERQTPEIRERYRTLRAGGEYVLEAMAAAKRTTS